MISNKIFDDGIHKLTIQLLEGFTRLGVGVMKLKTLGDCSSEKKEKNEKEANVDM